MTIPEWVKEIEPIFKRVRADGVKYHSETQSITAMIYERLYKFEYRDGRIVVSRGDLRSYFLLSEVEMLDHVAMPYIRLVEAPPGNYAFSEQRASDISMRLYLIMEGDICVVEEAVIFVNAGTQRSTNLYRAR